MQERLGFLNARLDMVMSSRNVSIRQVAEAVKCSSEQIRKILSGQSLPSDSLLDKLCAVLHLPKKELYSRRKKDRIIFAFGDVAWELNGMNPRAAPFYILLPLMPPDARNHVLFCMRAVGEARKMDMKKQAKGGRA